MSASDVVLALAEDLRLFLPSRCRATARFIARADGVSSLGHLVEAAGVPLTETGDLLVDGHAVGVSYRPWGGETAQVGAVGRPQDIPGGQPAFLLDVHLGALARRMRLVGLDTAYHNDRDDPLLVEQANAEHRVLLTQDRRLLHRKSLWMGAYVRGTRPEAQLYDVLDRFALPPLEPWTRCTTCNGPLRRAAKEEVGPELPRGTRESYEAFSRCADCGRVYWRGAHGARLEKIVKVALARTAAPGPPGGRP